MNQDEWLQLGIERGWCGPPTCLTHGGTPGPLSPEEEAELEDDDFDWCVHAVRLLVGP